MLWALEGAFFNFSDLWGNVLELCAKASSLSIEATASKMERLLIQVVEWFGPLGDRLQQGEDLAAAVNAAASEQNYEAE